MKLYMKQKVFSWTDRFTVKDENENDHYTVEGELISFGHKLHVYDANGSEAAFISQKVFSFMPTFEVYVDGVYQFSVVKEFSFFDVRYTLEGTDWMVRGDLFQHEYSIESGALTIAGIRKAWLSWGDSYEIDIADGVNEVPVIAAVLAIDCVLEQND